MQLMIDTKETNDHELRAAIALLQSLLPDATAGETADHKPVPIIHAYGATTTEGSRDIPPPPPPLPHEVEAADDVELDVGTDAAGNVTSLTTAAPLVPLPPVVASGALAPAAPVPAPPGPPVAAELDSRGYPWDNRIHAANRAKKLDGSWKNKRGVDPNLIVACESQNKPAAVSAVPAAVAGPVPVVVPPAAPAAPVVPPPPPPTAGSVPPAPPIVASVPSSAQSGAIDFRGLMMKIQQNSAAGKLTPEKVNAALASVGLTPTDMPQLIGNALYVASVNAEIDKALA